MTTQAALAARMGEYLRELERVVERAASLAEKAQNTGDEEYWDGVALNLHSFYSGVERIFEDIARTIDEAIPSSPEWHRALLLQMSAELPGRRPAVITQDTRYCLEDYRGFRHVVRNVYAFNFRPARLKELMNGLHPCFANIQVDLTAFIAFLKSL